uniref:Uncharacterized protein n=1 Tax=Haptolina brevifila TaxID=156173 RepID=A0A7S2FEV1_9EUKA
MSRLPNGRAARTHPLTHSEEMPTSAMEPMGGGMTRYRTFATNGVIDRRRKEQDEIAKEQEQREGLVRQSNALKALAEHMTAQNERMLEGLNSLSTKSTEPPAKVNHVARNIANVSAARQGIDRKGQALMARAEVMAAATAHLGGGSSSAAPPPRYQPPMPTRVSRLGQSSRLRVETEEDLVNAALAEIEHGQSMSAFESRTRKPPSKTVGRA